MTYPGTGQPMTAGVLADGSTVNHLTEHGRTVGMWENVKHYGAYGDGSHDDTTAIAAAYAAARAAGIPVLFPPGVYITAAASNPTGTVTHGYGATLKHKSGAAAFNMFQSTGPFGIYGLTVDMNKANVTDPASVTNHIAFYHPGTVGWSGAVELAHCSVTGAWGPAVRIGATASQTDPDNLPTANAIVSNCRITNSGYGMMLVGTTGARVENNVITSIVTDAIYDYQTLRSGVTGNTIGTTGGHGIVSQYSRQFVAGLNNVYDPGNGGVVIGGGDPTLTPASHFTITGNTIRNGTMGIQVDVTLSNVLTTTQNVYGTITGNVCIGNSSHGIYLQNAGYATIAGNTSQGNISSGIAVIGYRCAISGNVSTGNDIGIGVYGTAGLKGEHRIAGNVVPNNTSGGYAYDAYARIGTTVDIPTAALATNAPDGFLRIPTCAGVPSGTPTAVTGTSPLVYDTTNNNLYIYNGGGWKKTTVFS